jgi:hypothetical protein
VTARTPAYGPLTECPGGCGKPIVRRLRDGRKYRQGGFATFDDYVDTKLEISRQRAYQFCDSAYVVSELSRKLDTSVLPRTETHAHALLPLRKEPDKLAAQDAEDVRLEGERRARRGEGAR